MLMSFVVIGLMWNRKLVGQHILQAGFQLFVLAQCFAPLFTLGRKFSIQPISWCSSRCLICSSADNWTSASASCYCLKLGFAKRLLHHVKWKCPNFLWNDRLYQGHFAVYTQGLHSRAHSGRIQRVVLLNSCIHLHRRENNIFIQRAWNETEAVPCVFPSGHKSCTIVAALRKLVKELALI